MPHKTIQLDYQTHSHELNSVFEKAFSIYYSKSQPPSRDPFIWKLYLKKSYPFSLGINHKGLLAAFSIAHLWDSMIWLGPIGVLPQYRGTGMGSFLLQQQIEQIGRYLPRSAILLESRPEKENVSFYLKNNFLFHDMALKIVINLRYLGSPTQKKWSLTRILGQPPVNQPDIAPEQIKKCFGIDLYHDNEYFNEFKAGEIWYLRHPQNKLRAMILWQTRSPYNEDKLTLNGKAFLADTDNLFVIRELICQCAEIAREDGNQLMTLAIPAKFSPLLKMLPDKSYRLIQYTLTMIHSQSIRPFKDNLFYGCSLSG